jgi:hypothetical protein
MTSPSETAVVRFRQNLNCAQAVFSVFAPQFGPNEETALKLASPFGGGMALGLGRGGATPAKKEEANRLGQAFIRRFEEKHGTLLCRELISSDLSTPEGWQRAKENGVFETICPLLVHDGAEIVQALLEA